jgi:hypothetical protein
MFILQLYVTIQHIDVLKEQRYVQRETNRKSIFSQSKIFSPKLKWNWFLT